MGYHSQKTQSAQKAPKAIKALKALKKKTLDHKKTQSAEGILCQRQNDAFPILAVVQNDVW